MDIGAGHNIVRSCVAAGVLCVALLGMFYGCVDGDLEREGVLENRWCGGDGFETDAPILTLDPALSCSGGDSNSGTSFDHTAASGFLSLEAKSEAYCKEIRKRRIWICELEKSLVAFRSSTLHPSPSEVAREIAFVKGAAEAGLQPMQLVPLSRYLGWSALGIVLFCASTGVAWQLLVRDLLRLQESQADRNASVDSIGKFAFSKYDWDIWFFLVAYLFLFCRMLGVAAIDVMVYSSRFIDWDVLRVAGPAALFLLGTRLALAALVAVPMLLFWRLGRPRSETEVKKTDIRVYLAVLRNWTYASLVFVIVPAFVWLSPLLAPNPSHGVIFAGPWFGVVAFVVVGAGRLILRAYDVRVEFRKNQAEARSSKSEVPKDDEDPTLQFLGSWNLSLPVVASSFIGGLISFVLWSLSRDPVVRGWVP